MAGPSQLKSLEESLSDAKAAYRAASKVGPMPMGWPEYERQVRERHKVLSHMNEEQFDVAVAELKKDQDPMLHSLLEMLNQMIDAQQAGRGQQYAKDVIKRAKAAKREAKKTIKDQQT